MPENYKRRADARQLLGSLIAAVALIAVTIAVVTAKFGETPVAELEAREEAAEQRTERIEERREAAEEPRKDAAEERREDAAERGRYPATRLAPVAILSEVISPIRIGIRSFWVDAGRDD